MKACSCVCTKYVTLEILLIRWLLAELAGEPAYVAKEGDFSCGIGKWPVMVLGFGPLFPVSFCSRILLCVVTFYFPIPPCSRWSVSLLCSLCALPLCWIRLFFVFALVLCPPASSVLLGLFSSFWRLSIHCLHVWIFGLQPACLCVSCVWVPSCILWHDLPSIPPPTCNSTSQKGVSENYFSKFVCVCWGATVARMAFKTRKEWIKWCRAAVQSGMVLFAGSVIKHY